MRFTTVTLIVVLAVIFHFSPARAHSFNLLFLAPFSGGNAEVGNHALDGFSLATREQDAHDFEESDGHLGGLDSYIFRVDNAVSEAAVVKNIELLLHVKNPDFVTGIFTPGMVEILIPILDLQNVLLVNPVDSAIWQSVAIPGYKLETTNGGSFASEFQGLYGHQPNVYAYQGYIAARLIAATVRTMGGNLSASEKGKSALDMAREHLP